MSIMQCVRYRKWHTRLYIFYRKCVCRINYILSVFPFSSRKCVCRINYILSVFPFSSLEGGVWARDCHAKSGQFEVSRGGRKGSVIQWTCDHWICSEHVVCMDLVVTSFSGYLQARVQCHSTTRARDGMHLYMNHTQKRLPAACDKHESKIGLGIVKVGPLPPEDRGKARHQLYLHYLYSYTFIRIAYWFLNADAATQLYIEPERQQLCPCHSQQNMLANTWHAWTFVLCGHKL